MKKGIVTIVVTLLVSLLVISFTLFDTSRKLSVMPEPEVAEEELVIPLPEPEIKYGLVLDSLIISEHKIKRNQTLLEILTGLNVERETVFQIYNQSKSVYNLANIVAGNKYRLYQDQGAGNRLKAFVYEANPLDHIVVKLTDSVQVFREEKKVDTTLRSMGGMITSSLYETLSQLNAPSDLPVYLASVFAWQVDFFRMFEGDNFKIIYEEISVDGVPIKTGKIHAALFEQHGRTYYAFNFAEDGEEKFFNEEGKNVKGAFLKAPLKYFRITSRFAKSRFHPVLKRYKAHLGTDYAAPYGTPILAVGSGTVTEAAYSKYNGNYVKIKHNGTYTTQYLHMSRIGKGIRKGKRVQQGEVIGYVGSTGLATGPHVCFRFWKNGKQVDPRGVKVMESDPIKKANLQAFNEYKSVMMRKLDSVQFVTTEEGITMN